VQVENKGKYPIYNLTMLIRDVDAYNSHDDKKELENMQNEKQINIGDLGVEKAFSTTLSLALKTPDRNLKIQYTTKNSAYLQWIHIRMTKDGFKMATKVEQIDGAKLKKVYEKIDSGFLNKNEKSPIWIDYWFKKTKNKIIRQPTRVFLY